jgi:alpha-L-rhamnosidase
LPLIWLGGALLADDLRQTTAQGRGGDAETAKVAFHAARPVWPADREREMNLTVGFRASFSRPDGSDAVLRVTGSSLYRIHLNGGFVGHGPARAAHGYFRVDEWVLPAGLMRPENVVAIEVAGYNINSYYLIDQPSFLQAEVVSDGKVVAATCNEPGGFEATIVESRVQKVERYSFQRTFMESYRLEPGFDDWRTPLWDGAGAVACSVQSGGKMLPRRVAYPRFEVRQPGGRIVTGEMRKREIHDRPWRVLGRRSIGPTMKGFRDDEVDRLLSREMQGWTTASAAVSDDPYGPGIMRRLGAAGYETYDFGVNLTGFIGVSIRCETPTRLVLSFDEIFSNGDVDHQRLNCLNLIELDCALGTYSFETFEPYTLRFLKVVVLEGECEIGGITLREYAASDLWEASFSASDSRLNEIFEAARETCRQNVVDLFMDCPSRERAAWLCDSFFAARITRDLSGHARVEENFLENYLLPEAFANMPPGMVPPCYPSDQTEGRFIPNWALFLVIQLEEYLARTGDTALVEAFEPRVMAMLDYFVRFENEEGLLEKLESWVFVEWSEANNHVQDVSFPTCAVYAGALDAAGRMYGRADLADKADAVRVAIRRLSFDGTFFVDNAVRVGGRLQATTNRTETCQYYAFYFGVATPATHPRLWETLRDRFGPGRDVGAIFPDVSPSNAFVGNYLRLELLSRMGECRKVREEIAGAFHAMARRTGTLWEHMGPSASCNHGFASHIAHCLYRDVLGVHQLDIPGKRVVLRFADLGLDWCSGRMPTPDGFVELRWWLDEGAIVYDARLPAGYSLRVENLGPRRIRSVGDSGHALLR